MLRTDRASLRERTTLPLANVGTVSISEGVMTMTSFSFVPTLHNEIDVSTWSNGDIWTEIAIRWKGR